jgi:two-component system, OmpR family, response regulator
VTRILIAEDEAGIASFLQRGFEAEGFAAKVAPSGELALSLLRSGEFDLLVLDLGLPEMDGLTVLQELRKRDRQLPVVVLTARDSVADTIEGLDTGADDYVTKPFHFDELLARVRARLRPERTADAQVLTFGGASLDLRTKRAFVDGEMVELSAREFAPPSSSSRIRAKC